MGQEGDEKEIVEVSVTDRVDEMSVKNYTAVNIHVSNVTDYHQGDLSARIEQIEDLEIPLYVVSLSILTSLRASFCVLGFDYSGFTLPITIHLGIGTEDVTIPSLCGLKGRRHFQITAQTSSC